MFSMLVLRKTGENELGATFGHDRLFPFFIQLFIAK